MRMPREPKHKRRISFRSGGSPHVEPMFLAGPTPSLETRDLL
uniref:Uncharacterized protein n=1 Tax=Picea glauca TaxID=3330 RepID=A0A101M578_PICGL|nr:hypothetical protein ABT39_MTgene1066 [Picea glauca]